MLSVLNLTERRTSGCPGWLVLLFERTPWSQVPVTLPKHSASTISLEHGASNERSCTHAPLCARHLLEVPWMSVSRRIDVRLYLPPARLRHQQHIVPPSIVLLVLPRRVTSHHPHHPPHVDVILPLRWCDDNAKIQRSRTTAAAPTSQPHQLAKSGSTVFACLTFEPEVEGTATALAFKCARRTRAYRKHRLCPSLFSLAQTHRAV